MRAAPCSYLSLVVLAAIIAGCDGTPDSPLAPDGALLSETTSAIEAKIAGMEEKVADYRQSGDIRNDGIARGLSGLLSNAGEAARRDDLRATENMMGAFQNRVRAQRGKHISESAADMLDADAQEVVDLANGTAVLALADLSVSLTAVPDPVTAGEDLSYLVTIANAGPADVTDVLVSLLVVGDVAAGSAPTGCTSAAAADGLSYDCTVGALGAGTDATLTIVVVPQTGGETLSSQADIVDWTGADDPDLANNIAVHTMYVNSLPAVQNGQGDEVTGEMGSGDDIDRYTYEGTAGEIVQFMIHSAEGSTLEGTLTVFDPDAMNVGTLSFGPTPRSATIEVDQTGTYMLEVAPTANLPGSYVLAVSSGLFEIELHSNSETTFGGIDEVDRFVFAASAGTLVNVAYGSRDLEGRVTIALYDPAGTELVSTRSALVLYGGRYHETGIIELPSTGSYTIHLRAVDSGSHGTYTLGLAEIDPLPTPIAIASPYVDRTGEIRILGDRHFYSFSGNAADVMNVAIHTPGALTSRLHLRRPGNDPFYSRPVMESARTTNFNNSVAYRNAEVGRQALPESGEYVIEVNGAATIPLDDKFGPYGVRAFLPELVPVATDSELTGTIEEYFVFDRYSFDASAAPAVLIHTEHSLNGYLYTYLYDPEGFQMGWFRSLKPSYTSTVRHDVGPFLVGSGTYTTEQNPPGITLGDYRFWIVSIEEPTALTSVAPSAAGDIDVPGERDYFEFSGNADQTVSITVGIPSSSELTAAFRVYSLRTDGDFTKPGTLVFSDTYQRIDPGETDSRSVTLPADGRYIIELDGLASAVGPYDLQVEF